MKWWLNSRPGSRDEFVVATSRLSRAGEFLAGPQGRRSDSSWCQVRAVYASGHQDPEGDWRLAGKRTRYCLLYQERRFRLRSIQQSGLLCEFFSIPKTFITSLLAPRSRLHVNVIFFHARQQIRGSRATVTVNHVIYLDFLVRKST